MREDRRTGAIVAMLAMEVALATVIVTTSNAQREDRRELRQDVRGVNDRTQTLNDRVELLASRIG